MLSPPADKLYICPGETHPISRAVHLSRLAAFYPACRECPFRGDTGHIAPQTVARLRSAERRAAREPLFTREGVRGVYLNQLTRKTAGALAAALADLLWEEAPLMGSAGPARGGTRRPGPAVVVGYDERPSSPDIFTGVAEGLRRMGCQVVDVARTTKPGFWFAVDHLQAAAGILVTGAGCDPSWTGFDFVLRGALPLSLIDDPASHEALGRADLRRVEERFESGCGRPTRQAGSQRGFQAGIPYEAGLVKHFHALRPLRVCCATPTLATWRTLEFLFQSLPCVLSHVPTPTRARRLDDPADPDVRRLGETVRQAQAHVGILIDDDGQRCAFLDERGVLVPALTAARLLARDVVTERPGAKLVCESADATLLPDDPRAADQCVFGGPTLAEMSLAMRAHQASFGGGASGRYWFRESFPTSDAILVLARMLVTLSRSDAAFSALCASD